VAVALAGAGAWAWWAAAAREADAAYAALAVRIRAAEAPDAAADVRALAIREVEAALARHPSAAGAALAAYQLGNLRAAAGEPAAARGAYEIARAKAGSRTLRALAQASIAYTWEAEKKYDRAASVLQQALGGAGPKDFLYEQLLTSLGRIQELSGQKAEAIRTYQRVLAEVPRTRRTEEIRARLLALGS
jgi:tetratricopeptide (TPR) repeat protein